MKKAKKKLNLNKLVISKLNNPTSILGGVDNTIVCTTEETDLFICPTGTATCEETYYFTCGPCGTHIQTEYNC